MLLRGDRAAAPYRQQLHNFRPDGREACAEEPKTDKIRAAGNEAYVRTFRPGSVVRIYTPDGILRRQHTILAPGTTKFRLAPGVYIVALNGGTGYKIICEQGRVMCP
jgi:hypothetical protein